MRNLNLAITAFFLSFSFQTGAYSQSSKELKPPNRQIIEIEKEFQSAFNLNYPEMANACNKIWDSPNIVDKYKKRSSSVLVNNYLKWACETTFNTSTEMKKSAAELGLPLPTEAGIIDVNLEYSDDASKFQESRRNWCASARREFSQDTRVSEAYSKLSDGVTKSYEICVQSAKDVATKILKGVYVYAVPENSTLDRYTIVMNINPTSLSRRPRVNSITGLNNSVICRFEGNRPVKTPFTVSMSETSFTCDVVVGNGACISINVDELGASQPVCLPSVGDDRARELENRVKNLAVTIELQNKALSNIQSKFTDFKNSTATKHGDAKTNTGGGRGSVSECPPGQYVIGINPQDHDGGGACVECLTHVFFRCSSLPN